ncbi:seipin-like, partial [Lampetra planeri]
MDETSHSRNDLLVVIDRGLLRFQGAVRRTLLQAWQRVLQGFAVSSVALLILWIAAFLYGSFYYSYMPLPAYSTPVHYYYRANCDSPASFSCSYPMANISLMRNKKHVLTFGQAYQISLLLEMPDSPPNQEIGMFMIRTTCFSQDGGKVASSARSSMLRYRSDLLRTISTLLFFPAFVTGVAEQKQMLEVELFSDYTDDPYSPSNTAVIEILSNKVQIYSSKLYIHAHFTGIRYLLFNFPVLSAVVGVSTNFIFLSILFVFSYIRLMLGVLQKPVQSTMIELDHNSATVKGEALIRVGLMTGPAGTVNGETTPEATPMGDPSGKEMAALTERGGRAKEVEAEEEVLEETEVEEETAEEGKTDQAGS